MGGPCIYVVSWSETDIDGLRGAPPAALEHDAPWRLNAEPVVLEIDAAPARPDRLVMAAMRYMARRARGLARLPGFGEPVLGAEFTVTDGDRDWTGTLVHLPELARPLIVFDHAAPPARVVLRVGREPHQPGRMTRITDRPTGVICFTPGTRLRTPHGDRLVEELREGDLIETRDAGAQEIIWIGQRHMSGARLHAMPDLRPVRIRAGALGPGEPPADLVVSPRHKVLIRGAIARALFGETEVLASVTDLLNDRSILRDHAAREVEYVHILLPRHHVVWANGVETESFHPASTDLGTVEPGQLARLGRIVPGLGQDPSRYGPPARRELTQDEARLLAREAMARPEGFRAC